MTTEIPPSMSMEDLAAVVRAESPEHQLCSIEVGGERESVLESLKKKLSVSEQHNSQLIEEKTRLSHQLGVQTQVSVQSSPK